MHQVNPAYVPTPAQSQSYLPEYAPAAPLHLMTASEIPDRELELAIRQICATADLDDLTKKKVRKQLEQQFGVDLAVRKDTINALIEKVLTGSDDR